MSSVRHPNTFLISIQCQTNFKRRSMGPPIRKLPNHQIQPLIRKIRKHHSPRIPLRRTDHWIREQTGLQQGRRKARNLRYGGLQFCRVCIQANRVRKDFHPRTFLLIPSLELRGVLTVSRWETRTNPGIIPRAVKDVFAYIERTTRECLRCSYIEIYNETIVYLLAPPSSQLSHTQGSGPNVWLSPLREEVVTNFSSVKKILERGDANRRTASTN